MKRLFLLFPMLFVSLSFYVQTLKTYNGTDYANFGLGEVTYTYYLGEDGQEIKHGAYSFKETEIFSNPVGSQTGTLTGRYENGKQTGVWTYTYKDIDSPIGSNEYRTSTRIVKQSYKDGIPDGEWSFTISGKTRKQNINLRTRTVSWGGFETIKPSEVKINWKNGILVGGFKINHLNTNITGSLNSNGYLIGKWKVDNSDTEYTENGALKHMINRRYGEVYSKSFDKEIEIYNTCLLLPENEQKAFLRNHKLKISEIATNKLKTEIKSIFGNKVFSPEIGEYVLDNKSLIFGRYIELEFIEHKSINSFLGSDGNLSRVSNIDKLVNILNNHEIELSDADITAVKNRINELEIEKQKRIEEEQIKQQKLEEERIAQQLKFEEEQRIKAEKEANIKLSNSLYEEWLPTYKQLSYKNKLKSYKSLEQTIEIAYPDINQDVKVELLLLIECRISIDIFQNYSTKNLIQDLDVNPKNGFKICYEKMNNRKYNKPESEIISNTLKKINQ